jgi:DNA-directed RNA polymerase subunit RPC12/RpoP
MTDIIEDAEIEFQCENCGRKTKKSIEWIEDHDEFACDCGTMIPVDVSKFRKELVKAESELDGYQGLMEKLGK